MSDITCLIFACAAIVFIVAVGLYVSAFNKKYTRSMSDDDLAEAVTSDMEVGLRESPYYDETKRRADAQKLTERAE